LKPEQKESTLQNMKHKIQNNFILSKTLLTTMKTCYLLNELYFFVSNVMFGDMKKNI